jgi:hypothetical protein
MVSALSCCFRPAMKEQVGFSDSAMNLAVADKAGKKRDNMPKIASLYV